MAIPAQKSRFNVLHISDDDENDDGSFSKPKTRKNTRSAAAASKKPLDVPFLVTSNQPKKQRVKKPAKSKQPQENGQDSQEKPEARNLNGETRDADENDEDLVKALNESEKFYHMEKIARAITVMEDDEGDERSQNRDFKVDEKKARDKSKSKNAAQEIPQTLSDVASVLTRTKLESETQEYFDATQFDSSHYEKILAEKDIEIETHKNLAEKYKARFRRVLALLNECEYKDVADLSIECDQLKKSIAEYAKIQEELMSQLSEANKEVEQLKSRNRDLEKEYSRKYQNK